MKLLIVEPSPLTILIPLGSKYSPQDPFSNILSLRSSLNVRDHVSQFIKILANINTTVIVLAAVSAQTYG